MESEKQTLYLHCIMCILGGFLGAYAILCRLMNFGSSQTANMIDILCTLFEGDVTDFLLRLSGLVLYVLAMVICVLLTKKTALNVKRYAIFIDMAGLILLTFIPGDINPILGILPIFFMMATQWSVFSGNGEFNSSTIFSTNNLKQFTFALTNYVMEREKAQLRKAKFFGTSLLCYHIGVIFSFFACRSFGTHASLCALPLTFCALVPTFSCQPKQKQNPPHAKFQAHGNPHPL